MFCSKNKTEEILWKTLELFNSYGIKSVSMDDIASNLAISKKTLYRHVKDKQDLVDKAVLFNFDINTKKIDELVKPSMNAIEEIMAVVRFFLGIYKSHSPNMIFDLHKFYPGVYQKFKKRRNERLEVFYEGNFQKGIKEGFYRQNMDVSVVKRIIILLSEKIIESDSFTPEEIASKHFIKELYSYHLHGIVSDTGLEILNKELKNI